MNSLLTGILSRTRIVLSTLVFLLVAGAMAYINIPKESEPEVKIPMIFVNAFLDGVSPQDAERLLVRPLEEQFNNLEGVKELTAKAFQNGASVTLEFEPGADTDIAMQDVRNKVDMARPEMPTEMEEPTISEVDFSRFPMMVIALSGNLQERVLLQYARELRDEISTLSGVMEAEVTGAREEVVEIIIDPARVQSYQLNTDDLMNVFTRANRLVAAGKLDTGQGSFSVSVPGLFENASDILNMPVKATRDAVVRMKDIADIRRTFKDATTYVRTNGKPTLSISIRKRAGANLLTTSAQIMQIIEHEQETWPDALTLNITQDKSEGIRDQVGALQNSVFLAIFFVMASVIAALGLRSGLLVGVAIPGAFLTGILILSLMGLTINIVVMFGLILSVGILVDGALVVVEYADRKMAEGVDRSEAYLMASKRMAWPIVSSTATTIAAFVPLLFWPGFMGQMMLYMPITLIGILLGSLLMALIFVPSLGGLIGRPSESDKEMMLALGGRENTDYSKLSGPTKTYVQLLRTALSHPRKTFLGTIAFLIFVMLTYVIAGNGISFFPEERPRRADIVVHARGNLAIDEKDSLIREVEARIITMDDFKTISTRSGNSANGTNDVIGEITLTFKDWRVTRPVDDILTDIINRTSDIPGLRIAYAKERHGFASAKPVELELTSQTPALLNSAAAHVRRGMEEIGGFINTEDNRPLPGIEWRLEVDRAQAARFGADLTSVGSAVRMITNGVRLGTFRPDDSEEELDILVRYPDTLRSMSQLDELRIQTNKGLVPISNFVKRVPVQQETELTRIDGKRILRILSDIEPGQNTNNMMTKLKDWIAANPLDQRIRVIYKGDDQEQAENSNFLGTAFAIAMFLMGAILLIQFNSFYSVLLILSSVVLSTLGVLLGYVITGAVFSIVMSGIGVIALAGIVVNNNIVLIDTYDRLAKTAPSAFDAILHTGAQRLRPVFLTTFTTVAGLTPMAFGISIDFLSREVSLAAPSTTWWQPLAMTIIFGLLFATILTLFITPVLLMIRANRQERKAKKRGQHPGSKGVGDRPYPRPVAAE